MARRRIFFDAGESRDFEPGRLERILRMLDVARSSDAGIRNEQDALSKTFLVVLTYPEDGQERARQLARHLFEHGLETARIRLFNGKDEGPRRWATLVYVPDPARTQVFRDKLKTVPTPDFEPSFERRKAEKIDLLELK